MRRTFSTYGFFAAVYFECFYVTNFLGLNGSLLALILTLTVFQCFCQVFHSVLLLLYCKCYGYERLFFTLRHFWPFTPSPHLMQGLHNLLLSRFLWETAVLPWKFQDLPLWFKTRSQLICLLESHSVQQIVLFGGFYLCIKISSGTLYQPLADFKSTQW